MEKKISVITPTNGNRSLSFLIDSIKNQKMPVHHILLWTKPPNQNYNINIDGYSSQSIVITDFFNVQKAKIPSYLRSIGIAISTTKYFMFADDDTIWENNYLKSMIELMEKQNAKWGFCKRRIWCELDNGDFEYLGVDNFESVPNQVIDRNCYIVDNSLSAKIQILYKDLVNRNGNDDKLIYDMLLHSGSNPVFCQKEFINQIASKRLENFYREKCTI